ncbi:MAG TPA: hypothetical protein VG148_10790 [Pyrinomonadaceae bacterium]|nr:hypothetical protein [Pyrinomonadaceae bacterium]
MEDPTQDGPSKSGKMTPEDFARFMAALSDGPEEAGRRYTRLHQKLVGFFKLKGIADPPGAADVTIDRAAVKVVGGAAVPDVERFCLGIARNICKERWRRERRESEIFRRFLDKLDDNADEEVERIERLLKPCFGRLSGEDQKLLRAYCQVPRGRARAEHRRRLAEEMRTSVLALRMRVTRLRSILTDCVKKSSNGG